MLEQSHDRSAVLDQVFDAFAALHLGSTVRKRRFLLASRDSVNESKHYTP